MLSRYSQQSASYSGQHYIGPGGGPDVGAYYGGVEDFPPGYRDRYHAVGGGGGGSGGRGGVPMDWRSNDRGAYDDYRRSGEYERRPPPAGS